MHLAFQRSSRLRILDDTFQTAYMHHIIIIQHGGKKLINIVCNNDFVCVYVSDNMAVVAGMGLGVLLVLIFWALGIIGCVVLSRASGGLK